MNAFQPLKEIKDYDKEIEDFSKELPMILKSLKKIHPESKTIKELIENLCTELEKLRFIEATGDAPYTIELEYIHRDISYILQQKFPQKYVDEQVD